MKPCHLGGFLGLVVMATSPHAAVPLAPSYDLRLVDQQQMPANPDPVPPTPAVREVWARSKAYLAALYGTAPVLEYQQMYAQAVDRGADSYTGFNVFAHGRNLAGPGYKPFKTPNADTLYSNAWLDLSRGPVVLTVPPTGKTYYTVNFDDAYGNATNISARTHGFAGGRYLIVPASWKGAVPAGLTRFTVATPYTWILLRILTPNVKDLPHAHALQDGFRLEPIDTSANLLAFPSPRVTTALDFFRILDFVARINGHPTTEDALVHQFAGIGIAGDRDFDEVVRDEAVRRGMEAGYADAQAAIADGRFLSGRPVGAWSQVADVGRYGYNSYYSAIVNTLGTGGNVETENYPFNTFKDANGNALDGSKASYALTLAPPPPARFFWSVTLYDGRTKELSPNPIGRYLISDRTPGLVRGPGGSVEIALQANKPGAAQKGANWLPTPKGPFYLVIRAQGPSEKMLAGRWVPQPVRRVSAK